MAVANLTALLKSRGMAPPLVIRGAVHKTNRPAIVRAFQEASTKNRLLISNLRVIALGLSLDDTDGNYPRFAFGSPSYKVMELHQWSRRCYRTMTRSNVVVRIVYGGLPLETSILNAIVRRSKTAKEVTSFQGHEDTEVLFPGDYRSEIESELTDTETMPFFEIDVPDSVDELELAHDLSLLTMTPSGLPIPMIPGLSAPPSVEPLHPTLSAADVPQPVAAGLPAPMGATPPKPTGLSAPMGVTPTKVPHGRVRQLVIAPTVRRGPK